MNVRVLVVALSVFAAIGTSTAHAAGAQSNRPALKIGSYFLGDDTAGGFFGTAPSVSAGFEYPFRTNLGTLLQTSLYLDYAHSSGPVGALALYSAGIAERVRIGRQSHAGAFLYVGAGVGTNINVFSLPGRTAVREAAFAQKFMIGAQRSDGIFYEAYFRTAPENASIITSGVGVSLGYHL